MDSLFRLFFHTEGFMPHGMCFLWRPNILKLFVVSDLLIAASYFSIPLALAYFAHKRKDLQYKWVFILFSIFILACGTTHILDSIVIWNPIYGIAALLKAFTAVISVVTAILLWPLIPKALKIPSTEHLKVINQQLAEEISYHKKTKLQLEELTKQLDQKVSTRTQELSQASETLLTTQSRLQRIIDFSPAAIYTFTPENNDENTLTRTFMSKKICDIVGYTPEEWLNDEPSWQSNIHPDDCKIAQQQLDEIFLKDHIDVTYRFIDKKGATRWLHDERRVVRNHAGNRIEIVGGILDITERKEIDETIRRSQKMEAIGQLTGGIAHDFNNLLAIIHGNLEMIIRGIVNGDAAQERLQLALKTVKRGADMTHRLLDFSRPKSSTSEITQVNSLIDDMKMLLDKSLMKKIDLRFELAQDLGETTINAGEFQDALLNLCFNARDAMPDGGMLQIKTQNRKLQKGQITTDSPGGDFIEISICDSGLGMDASTIEKIFNPFFTTKDVGKGTGLGLSMVYGFVKRSLGEITVDSQLRSGTTFRLFLPRSHPPTKSVTKTPTSALQDLNGIHILLVDDEVELLDVMAESLADMGAVITTAINATEALGILTSESDKFQLLISDIVMPDGVNGFKLAVEAKSRWPHLYILLTSGYANEALREHDRQTPRFKLLDKPYTLDELLHTITLVMNEEKD